MGEFEKKSLAHETGIEKPEGPEVEQERLRQSVIRDIVDSKRSTDSAIESKTKSVQSIVGSLERRTVGEQETKETSINNPEEILSKVKDDLLKIEKPTIDDISRVLITSGLQTRDIESWLAVNKSELQSLSSGRKNLETRGSGLSAELTLEEQKNFFAKLFRGKERKTITAQLREVSDQTVQIDTVLGERQSRGSQIESAMQEITSRLQELALNATEQLFQNVAVRHQQLKEKLTSPEIKQGLNVDLIAQRVLPELDKLRTEGKITDKDAEEYIDLLKAQLAEGNQSGWDDPIEKKEVVEARRKRMNELNYDLRNLGHRVSSEGNTPADKNYDRIFDFLIREMTKGQVERVRDTLGSSLPPELQERVGKITEGIIYPYPYYYYRTPRSERKDVLDLSKIPIEDFKGLDGLERWQIVKKFAESSGVIPRETFEQVERVIIQRLFEEQLFPGGRESGDGTSAAGKMGDLGNPEALPLMLRHIEASGSGHTNNAVVYEMERLLKESDPETLQKTLEVQPKNKRFLLQTLGDENSYMSRFGKSNSRYSTCSLLQNGDLTVAKEQLTKILENGGTLDEEKVRDFYLGHSEDAQETLEPLLKARTEVEKVIVDSKLNVWTQSADKLLAALVNPKYGESVAFPKKIAQEGL
ncbi:MAG: hypothetical protein WCI76_03440, partial [bacterium]